jgi:hypothetical protein
MIIALGPGSLAGVAQSIARAVTGMFKRARQCAFGVSRKLRFRQ